MKKPFRTRHALHTAPNPLRISPVAAAVSTLALLAGSVQAQSSDSQTVVVTGIRRAVESAITLKRNADAIVEAVSAEDIGKLPDVSIAESLARLPGVAGQRVNGRAQVLALRGLAPDFTGTTLNGRTQVTTGDNRAVEFDQFPSEFINAALVYKTPEARLLGQGLSGTVDLRMIRPLDSRGRQVAIGVRGEQNSNGALNKDSDATGNRFNVSYVDQFANNTVGVALGLSHLDTPTQTLHYKAWGFSTFPSTCRTDWGCGQPSGGPDGSTYLNGYEATAVSASQKRDGAVAVLEFKPNKNLHSTVDLYYSKFKRKESMRGLMGGLGENWNGVPGAAYSNVTTTPVGGSTTFINGAHIDNTVMVVRNDLNDREDTLSSVGWNTLYKVGNGFSLAADLSYSGARRKENVIETYAGAYSGAAKALSSFDVSLPTGSGFPTLVPTLDYTDVANTRLSDPAVWSHDGLWKKPRAKDEIKALRLEGRQELDGAFTGLDFGVSLSERTKEREMNELAANLKNSRAAVSVSNDLLYSPTSLGFAGIPGVLSYDVMGALAKYYDLVPQATDQVINRNYEVSEKVYTVFAQLGIDTRLGGLPLRGNVGLQFVQTHQSSHGYSRLSNVVSETTRGTEYSDLLPSLNLVADLGSNTLAKVGVARTLARGRMDDMRAGAEVSINATSRQWSGSGGNPQLEPWRAISYDFSLEKYLGKRSYVAAALFHKKLLNYIYTQRLEYDFSGIPNTTNIQPASNVGLFNRPMNGQGGRVQGAEFSFALDGALASPALEGFGLLGSVSKTSSDIQPNGPGSSQKLPGLSGTVWGLTAYYERHGFSARVSQRYRSAFRGEINGLHNAREFTEILADKQTDLQLGYSFDAGALKGLGLLLQVYNVTDSPYATRQGNGLGDAIAPGEYNKYGRYTLLGATYKF